MSAKGARRGEREYVVRQGDCISSIAHATGFAWKTLWDHPRNAALKELRRNPNVLLPGDRVFIPKLNPAKFICETGKSHTFVIPGAGPSRLRIALTDHAGKPRSGLPFTVEVGGLSIEGATTNQGMVECHVPPTALRANLVIRDGAEEERYELLLGHLDPISENTGVQARLNNLGFKCGAVDGEVGPKTKKALRDFQTKHGLKATGELDDATRNALVRAYGF